MLFTGRACSVHVPGAIMVTSPHFCVYFFFTVTFFSNCDRETALKNVLTRGEKVRFFEKGRIWDLFLTFEVSQRRSRISVWLRLLH